MKRVVSSPFFLGAFLVAVALALFASPFASSSPDGLEKVAIEEGFGETADDHALGASPLADYGVDGVEDERVGTAVSGLIGVLVTFGVGLVLFGLLRRRRSTAHARTR